MPRKQKLSIVKKVELVRQCINGEISISGAAQKAGVAPKSVRRWIIAYEAEGAAAFLPHDQNRVYNPELYLLLQQSPRTTQSGDPDANGKAPAMSADCVNKTTEYAWTGCPSIFCSSHGTAVPCTLKRLTATQIGSP